MLILALISCTESAIRDVRRSGETMSLEDVLRERRPQIPSPRGRGTRCSHPLHILDRSGTCSHRRHGVIPDGSPVAWKPVQTEAVL
jgi:hypothetical protein